MTSPYRASTQHRAPPVIGGATGNTGSWLNWLDMHYDTSMIFDENAARDAYDSMIASWNEGMGDKPTFEEFLAWLRNSGADGYTINGKNYKMPIGDIWPLILIALAYMAVMFVRKRKELIK